MGAVIRRFGGHGLTLQEGEDVFHVFRKPGYDARVRVCLVDLAGEHLIEGHGFEPAGAAETPAGLGQLAGEEGFVPGLRIEFGFAGGEKLIELGLIFVREDTEVIDAHAHFVFSVALRNEAARWSPGRAGCQGVEELRVRGRRENSVGL